MRKMHEHHAQNARTSCAKYTNVMLKMQKRCAQNAETLCSKCGNVMLKMRKLFAQNAERLCSKCGNVMLKMQKCYAQNVEMKKTHPEVEILRLSLFKPLGCLLLKCLPRTRTARSNDGHASYFAEAPCFLALPLASGASLRLAF